jgi:cbb3-type cytochrome c oxidase subunit III
VKLGALLGVALLLAVVGGGCGGTGGLSEGGSASSGAQLFVQKCGGCHTLRAAGTQGTIGPNLDDAFAQPRADGIPDSTIKNVVHDQIKYPSPPQVSGDVPAMPKNLVTGEDADSVAAYVASVAAVPGAKVTTPPPAPPPPAGGGGGGGAAEGKSIFTSNCASCHTLADAGTSGTIGPNLDQAKPDEALVKQRVTNGMGVMPSFKGKLTDAQIDAVAKYVSQNAGQ